MEICELQVKSEYLRNVLEDLEAKNQHEPEFIQAAKEVLCSIEPVIIKHEEEYKRLALLERILEPERIISFRVPWIDDNGIVQVNHNITKEEH